MQTVTSQAFNQNPTAVKRAATKEPVKITERGKVSHVLLSIAEYEHLTGQLPSIVDLLAMEDAKKEDRLKANNIVVHSRVHRLPLLFYCTVQWNIQRNGNLIRCPGLNWLLFLELVTIPLQK